MREIDGMICDLDGTLVDSEQYHLEAWNVLLRRHGCVPPHRWNDDCIGLPDEYARDKACGMFPKLSSVPDLLEQKHAVFIELTSRRGRGLVFPGVAEKLTELAAAGMKLAVGTNSPMDNAMAILDASGLGHFFPVVVALDVVKRGKPYPDIYETAAERLGLPPERCIVLEDSQAGVESAKSAGCTVLGVLNTWSESVLLGADRIFNNTPSAMDWALSGRAKAV